jgi:hypothetical protein
MAVFQSFEFISTILFLGTVSVGFASIIAIVLYNIAFVLIYEAQQVPAIAAIYLLFGLLGALFLAESIGMELKAMDEEDVDESGVERGEEGADEEPIPLDEDPIAFSI